MPPLLRASRLRATATWRPGRRRALERVRAGIACWPPACPNSVERPALQLVLPQPVVHSPPETALDLVLLLHGRPRLPHCLRPPPCLRPKRSAVERAQRGTARPQKDLGKQASQRACAPLLSHAEGLRCRPRRRLGFTLARERMMPSAPALVVRRAPCGARWGLVRRWPVHEQRVALRMPADGDALLDLTLL